jgi:biopolymer transport protein ExbB
MREVFAQFIAKGGFVMWPLVGVSLILWTQIGLRFFVLRRGYVGTAIDYVNQLKGELGKSAPSMIARTIKSAAELLQRNDKAITKELDVVILEGQHDLSSYRYSIRSLSRVAPLLGLLGTVSGMIHTFESMHGYVGFQTDVSVAGGISEALVSTQMGLIVAIPGLLLGRLLDRREVVLQQELLQAREHIIQTGRYTYETR